MVFHTIRVLPHLVLLGHNEATYKLQASSRGKIPHDCGAHVELHHWQALPCGSRSNIEYTINGLVAFVVLICDGVAKGLGTPYGVFPGQ